MCRLGTHDEDDPVWDENGEDEAEAEALGPPPSLLHMAAQRCNVV